MTAPTGNAWTPSLPTRVEGTWSSPGYRSARTRARWAQVLVGIAAVINVVTAIADIYGLSLLDRLIDGSATESEEASFLRFVDSLNSSSTIVMIVSAIAVFAWLSRTVEIVPPLGGGTPRRSPREAIEWWFVPIANFFIPYQIVRDVYRRLETPTRRGGDRAILAWWLLFIGGPGLAASVIAVNTAKTTDAVRTIIEIASAANIATAVGGFLLVRIVGEIEARATERAVSLRLSGPEAVWPAQSKALQGLADATKVCPGCAETIKAAAAVCRFCGHEQGASGSTDGIALAAPAWTPTHRVADEGMAAWAAPGPSLPSAVTLDGGLDLVVAERAGDWARVVAVNGWTGWVDGRLLVPSSIGASAENLGGPGVAASVDHSICTHCGHEVTPGWTVICDKCRMPLA